MARSGNAGRNQSSFVMEFWEKAFREKQKMWGEGPAISAIETSVLFKEMGFRKILIPGVGYGRNAKVFLEAGMEVAGIEISETAIALGKQLFGSGLRIVHGSALDMPFDSETYDGVFSHALIHLFDAQERRKLIADCFDRIVDNGAMVFTAITKNAGSFGAGTRISRDRFRTKDGVDLFFYDESSIEEEFGRFGLEEMVKYLEPVNGSRDSMTELWRITCRKRE